MLLKGKNSRIKLYDILMEGLTVRNEKKRGPLYSLVFKKISRILPNVKDFFFS